MERLMLCRKGLHHYDGRRCPECKKVYDASRYFKHCDEMRAYHSAYYVAHRERKKAAYALWYAANPGYRSAWILGKPGYGAAVQRAHPEYGINNRHLRRSRKLGNAGNERVTKAHLALLLDAQDGCCRYCRTPLGKDKHLDHRIPLSKGGAHAPHNVCWACPSCNLKKHTMTESDFLGNSQNAR